MHQLNYRARQHHQHHVTLHHPPLRQQTTIVIPFADRGLLRPPFDYRHQSSLLIKYDHLSVQCQNAIKTHVKICDEISDSCVGRLICFGAASAMIHNSRLWNSRNGIVWLNYDSLKGRSPAT
ncbi:hypothetical protein GWI33_009306 [Rhynchophorus ferrugineus]|uniref:Uncharacterized protein n=1 Tax=Rhynchophorus ferrugineus TaxID=354439 RepID=A0A834MFB2_RHYFE|nr:hypothetical protein GWI33_009306 [Rhynchophorus ferrugineus]